MTELPEGRDALRARVTGRLPRWYSPWAHLLIPGLAGIALIILCITMLRPLAAGELLAAGVWLVACNAIEWNIHRHLLHHRSWAFYDKHTPEHHGIFRDHDMAIRSRREFALVLIPGYAVLALFLVLLPIAGALMLVRWNLGLLFYATSAFYVLAYEWMHLLYHLPEPSRGWIAPIAWLQRHHALHHDPKLMQGWNFNTTLPLWDRVKGTAYRRLRPAPRSAG